MSAYHKFTIGLFILFLTLVFSCSTIGNSEDLKPFKISIQKTEDGVELKGIEGTAWTDLSFSLKNNQTQGVDEYGMVTKGHHQHNRQIDGLADFLFTITKKDKAILLEGIEGSDWTELSYVNNNYQNQMIDESGMTQ